MELTTFETRIFFLRLIHNRMIVIAKNLPKLRESKGYDFRSVTREYTIILLHNFIKIKKLLDSEREFRSKPALNSCLEPFWKPVFARASAIQDMRNGHYAHVGEKGFDIPLPELLKNSQFQASYGDLLFLVLCVCGYAQYCQANFKKELETAIAKLNLDLDFELPHELSYQGARNKIKQIENQVVENLRKSNLAYET